MVECRRLLLLLFKKHYCVVVKPIFKWRKIDIVCNPLGKSKGNLIQPFLVLGSKPLATSTPYIGAILVVIVLHGWVMHVLWMHHSHTFHPIKLKGKLPTILATVVVVKPSWKRGNFPFVIKSSWRRLLFYMCAHNDLPTSTIHVLQWLAYLGVMMMGNKPQVAIFFCFPGEGTPLSNKKPCATEYSIFRSTFC